MAFQALKNGNFLHESSFSPLLYPANTNIRFKFHASATRLNSPLTFFNPRSENCWNPSIYLMMPNTGSTVHLRFAYSARPAIVSN